MRLLQHRFLRNLSRACSAGLAALACDDPATPAPSVPVLVSVWRAAPISAPVGLAQGPQGEIYVLEWHFRVQEFDAQGRPLSVIDIDATGMDVDPQGNLYIVERSSANLLKLDRDEQPVLNILHGRDWTFDGPIAVDGSSNVYLASSDNCIRKYDIQGRLAATWGTSGEAPGQFRDIRDIAVDAAGHVYVVEGTERSASTWLGNGRVQKFDDSGVFLDAWGRPGFGAGEFHGPTRIAIDHDGEVTVADGAVIDRFTRDGAWIDDWGGGGFGCYNGRFARIGGIALDGKGHLYVADTHCNRVQVFRIR